MQIKKTAVETLYVLGPKLGNYVGDEDDYYYLISQNNINKDIELVETVDCIYCWFHNYKYYRPLLKRQFGKGFDKLEKLRNAFFEQNQNRFKVLWGMGDDNGLTIETGIIVCYDTKLNKHIYFRLQDEEYTICEIDYNKFTEDQNFPRMNYNENIIFQGTVDSESENKDYQSLMTLCEFLIEIHYGYIIDGSIISNFHTKKHSGGKCNEIF